MAFLLRLSANTLRKSSHTSTLNLLTDLSRHLTTQTFVKMPIPQYISNFSEKRNNYVKYKGDKSKDKQFYDLIYTGTTESDIEQLIQLLKVDKSLHTNSQNSHLVFKLLYFLDKPDKALEAFTNQELNKILSQNQQVVELLIAQLEMKKQHVGVVQVFESFFEHLKASKSLKRLNNNSIVDSVVESLHALNTVESMEKLGGILQSLRSEAVKISNRSLIHLVLFSIEQVE